MTLMYHDIIETENSGFQNAAAQPYKVTAQLFEQHLEALSGHDDVFFTFDDGGSSFVSTAAPLLEKYGRRGVFFIATDYLDTPGFLTTKQVKELNDRGHKIGTHTHTHPENLSRLDEQTIEQEWDTSINILKAIIGEPITSASLPNGYGSKAIYNILQQKGICDIYTSEPNGDRRQSGTTLHGRFVVKHNTTQEALLHLFGSRSYRHRIHLKWQLLNFVKEILGGNYERIKNRLAISHHTHLQ